MVDINEFSCLWIQEFEQQQNQLSRARLLKQHQLSAGAEDKQESAITSAC